MYNYSLYNKIRLVLVPTPVQRIIYYFNTVEELNKFLEERHLTNKNPSTTIKLTKVETEV